MSLICPKCQTENKNDATFCSNCGQALDKEKDYKRYDSIGGWLILLGIGIVVSPLRILVAIGELNTLLENTALLIEYPKLESLLRNELMANAVLLLGSFYIIYLFFTKKRIFPMVFIVWLIVNVIAVFIDGFMVLSHFKDVEDMVFEAIKAIFASCVTAIIWITYMLISKRVKGTFAK